MKKKIKRSVSLLVLLSIVLLRTTPLFAQQVFKVSGTVSEISKEKLMGANVLEKGTGNIAITDINGRFTLNVSSEDAVIEASFIGFMPQEVAVDGRTDINITLQDNVEMLSGVLVVGYGTQKKKDLTGSVAVIDVAEALTKPSANVGSMLEGRSAGLTVTGDAAPGGDVAVRIRGFGTIRNNDPLYIVDGVPLTSGLSQINPNDIESMQVLKDASSASIYGSRAANGVIIITTKKGKRGKLKVSFDGYVGLQAPGKMLETLNAQEYGDLLWEAHINDGKQPSHEIYGNGSSPVIGDVLYEDGDNILNSGDTKWINEVTQTATIQSYNLSLSGGSDKYRQSFSLGYFNQDGVLKHTGYERISARLNSEYDIAPFLSIGENLSASFSWSTQATNNSVLGGSMIDAYKMLSVIPVYDNNGNYSGGVTNDIENPVAGLYYDQEDTQKKLKMFGNLFATVNILDNLTFKSNFGIDYSTFYVRDFDPIFHQTGTLNPVNNNELTTSHNWKFDWTWSNILSYSEEFGKHNIKALIGMESISSAYEEFDAYRQSFPYNESNFRYLDSGDASTMQNSGTGTEWSLLSYMAKVDYIYDERYLGSATFRRDGSSKLGGEKWGNFSAISLGWRVSEEQFFSSETISNLKVRVGWGQNGNQDIPTYATMASYSSNPNHSNYSMSGSQNGVTTGYTASRFANPSLKWEITTQTNFGLNLGLLDNAIDITVDYYDKDTKDLLLERPLEPTIGGTNLSVWDNVGTMNNRGVEFAINYHSKEKNSLSYDLGLNISHYKNRLTSLNEDIDYLSVPSSYLHSINFDQETSRTYVGSAVGSFYGHIAEGTFKTEAEVASSLQPNAKPGDLKFKDVTPDGIIDDKDRTITGDPHPDLTIGLNAGFHYKQYDMTLFFTSSIGNEVYDLTKYYGGFYNLSAYNKLSLVKDAWSSSNSSSETPRLTMDDPNNNIRPSSYYVSNASYLRLNNLSIGYTFNENQLGINNGSLRLYLQATNLFTITSYDGMDPSVGMQNYGSDTQNLDFGVDRGLYPSSRTFTFGLNFGF